MKYVWLAWGQAVVATLMSLYYSEVVGLAPCKLCWWQRIFMYPLVIILAVGIKRKDKRMDSYVIPLAIGGLLVAIYQNIETYITNYTNVLGGVIVPCVGGVSCTTIRPVFWFITIPMLSFLAFAIILGAMWMYRKERQRGIFNKLRQLK